MAKNLNYDAGDNCWSYGDDELNTVSMGRLYKWGAALTACPSGWHLTTYLELDN